MDVFFILYWSKKYIEFAPKVIYLAIKSNILTHRKLYTLRAETKKEPLRLLFSYLVIAYLLYFQSRFLTSLP